MKEIKRFKRAVKIMRWFELVCGLTLLLPLSCEAEAADSGSSRAQSLSFPSRSRSRCSSSRTSALLVLLSQLDLHHQS